MKVFISHAHDEEPLANAWKALLQTLAPGLISWYSSDRSQIGGIGIGKWREQISEQLQSSDVVLTLISPEALERPWIYFESAFALGIDSVSSGQISVIPIVYNLDNSKIPSTFQDLQAYRGDDKDDVAELCARLVRVYVSQQNIDPPPSLNTKYWEGPIEAYLDTVRNHEHDMFGRWLFRSHFHTNETANRLAGEWFAKWTQFLPDGSESVFEAHSMLAWSTQDRFRMVGEAKGHLDWYPMEGVISSLGHIAMSYWSQDENPICGTALLKLIAGNRMMKGTWQGYTARDLDYEALSFVSGQVVMARDRKKVEAYDFKD